MTSTRIVRPFAGRERAFDVAPLGIIERLERACDAGMGQILGRLQGRYNPLLESIDPAFRHADIRETVRLGLVGAGVTDAEATELVIDAVDGQPIIQHLGLAVAIMSAYAFGVDDALKKSDGAEVAEEASAPASSPQVS